MLARLLQRCRGAAAARARAGERRGLWGAHSHSVLGSALAQGASFLLDVSLRGASLPPSWVTPPALLADRDVRLWRGARAVHLAVAGGHARMLPLLAGAGANLDAPRASGATPLMDAIISAPSEVVVALMAAGASPSGSCGSWRATPLHLPQCLGVTAS